MAPCVTHHLRRLLHVCCDAVLRLESFAQMQLAGTGGARGGREEMGQGLMFHELGLLIMCD